MTIYVGGLRRRLIKDSIFNMIDAALGDLGWYDPGRKHLPINFITEAIDNNVEITFNTLNLADEDESVESTELGSNYDENRWTYYLDFYGESSALSLHMVGDLVDILKGKMPSIGRTGPVCDVYDYTLATPARIFSVEIENVIKDRAHQFPRPWQRYWYTARFEVLDAYGDEDDS